MIVLTVAALAYAAGMTILFAVVKLGSEDTISGLRDQLDAEQKSAAHWYRVARDRQTRLEWSGNVTPSFVGERPTIRAAEPQWTDAAGEPVGFHVPAQRKGES